MLTTEQASEAIRAAMPAFGVEAVALEACAGRVLGQDVVAERDQPPFDRVTMDGIAVDYKAIEAGERRFRIQARQHAGDPRLKLEDTLSAIEIMTGAVLPEDSDCIVPVERISLDGGFAELEPGYSATQRQFIHPRGSDHTAGTTLLAAGHRIAAADVAIIASCGLASVQVSTRPAIRVISTGNELVAAGEPIEDHQVRMSNGPAIVAMLQSHGYADCRHDHIIDDKAVLASKLEQHLQQAGVLVLSGGVSMGKADFVPEVLASLGVTVVFHKISQRPGKPMWFGIGPDDQAVFALPGNPVSTLVCCRQYVLPALAAASGDRSQTNVHAALANDFTFKPALTCFQPVRLASSEDGRLLAETVSTNTSGDFAALTGTDGYIVLPLQQSEFPAGSTWPVQLWDKT